MNYPFSNIIIIYNPNSTGQGEANAKNLAKTLRKTLQNVTVSLKETEYAGHAEKIGAEHAKKDEKVLLVSSSGDGGYNELINGILSEKSKNVAVCILPSGNANDHYNAVNGEGVTEKIIAGKTRKLDVIKVSAKKDGNDWTRYAHSYVGIGMTAYIGKKLTEAELNPINEKWLTLKYLLLFRSVKLKISSNQKAHRYSNVIIANIDRMSKVIKLDQNSAPDDGRLELYTTRAKSLPKLLSTLFFASTIGLKPRRIFEKISIDTKKPIEIQLDGEVTKINSGRIQIRTEHAKIKSIS